MTIVKKEIIYLVVMVILAISVRLWQGIYTITFPYDQARDVLMTQSFITHRDLPLLGPVSDIPGVHHGPWWYYFLLPTYSISNYDPVGPLVALIILCSFAAFPLFFVTKSLFSDTSTAYLTVLLYTFSFESIGFSRWLSNPVLAYFLMPWFLLTLWKLWNKKNGGAFFSGVLLGLLTGVELVLAHQIITVLIILIWRRHKFSNYLRFLLGGMIGAAPLLLADVKFHFQATRGVLSYLTSQTSGQIFGQKLTAMSTVSGIINWAAIIVRNNIFGLMPGAALVLLIGLLITLWKLYPRMTTSQKDAVSLLLLVFCMYSTVLLIGNPGESFFFIGASFPLLMCSSFALHMLLRNNRLLLTGLALIMCLAQLHFYFQQAQLHQAYVQVQEGVLLSDRKDVIDRIYEKIGKSTPFSISVFGTPYGIRTTWAYYFSWYTQRFGGMKPTWYGFAANGYVGDEILQHTDAPAAAHVTIYEPRFSAPDTARQTFDTYQDEHTTVVEQFTVHDHLVQIRKPI